MEHIRIGKEEDKARVLTGGERWGTEGYYIKPTVFVDIKPSARICREEIFGPVLVVLGFKTEEEAIALANDSEYGLAAAVHSSDANQIARVTNELEAGTVWIKYVARLLLVVPSLIRSRVQSVHLHSKVSSRSQSSLLSTLADTSSRSNVPFGGQTTTTPL